MSENDGIHEEEKDVCRVANEILKIIVAKEWNIAKAKYALAKVSDALYGSPVQYNEVYARPLNFGLTDMEKATGFFGAR
jgi:hypothetical protein